MGRALSVIGVPTGAGQFSAALEGLTALNEYTLRANPSTPALYDAGVSYTKEATDKWRPLTEVLKTKSGDCEALSTWRAAELRVSGEDPRAAVVVYQTGPSKYHAIVLRGNGTVEDPSVLLGMKPPSGLMAAYDDWNSTVAMAPRQEDHPMVMGNDDVACAVIGANDAPHDGEVVYDVVGTDDGYKGVIRVPLSDGRAIFAETSTARTPREAAGKAQRVLGVIGSVWDDLLVLAPTAQAQAAIRLARNQHVQNLATAAYSAGKKAIGKGGSSSSSSAAPAGHVNQAAVDRFNARHANDVDAVDDVDDGTTLDHGQGFSLEDGTPMATDVAGFFEVNGVVCGADELAILGAVNDALARGSKPRTIGAAARTTRQPARSGGAQRSGGGSSSTWSLFQGAQSARGGGQTRASASSGQPARSASTPRASAPQAAATPGFHVAPPPLSSAPSPFAPTSFGPTSFGSSPGSVPAYSGGPPAGFNPQSAAAQYLQQRQQNQAKSALLRQSSGSDGGGGGGGGGGGYDGGGGYTAADSAAAEQADADLFTHYYGNLAQQQQEEDWFNTAQETDADQFFGAVDPYAADAMLRDDSIPAE